VKKDEESRKFNPSKEWVEYEIGQKTIAMKTIKNKIKQCSNKHQTKIVKLMCL
jgi:hypothetical protein